MGALTAYLKVMFRALHGDYCFIYLLGCFWHQLYAGFGVFSYFWVRVAVWRCRVRSQQAHSVPASRHHGCRGCRGGSENPRLYGVGVVNRSDLIITGVRQPAPGQGLQPPPHSSRTPYLSHLRLSP